MTNLPVPIPRNFTVGESETGSYLNTALRDATNFLLNPPDVALYQATLQSVPNNAFTAVSFDATTVDSYGGHSNVTNNTRYTATVAGWWTFGGGFGFSANATGSRGGSLYKNGSALTGQSSLVQAVTSGGAVTVTPLPFCLVQLNVGDYVEFDAYQVSGGALNTNGGGQFCSYLNGWWLHA